MDITCEQIIAIRVVSAPGVDPGAGARRFPYRREPYGRATIHTALGPIMVDSKVLRTKNGPLVEFWRLLKGGVVLDVFIPGEWAQPIRRDESAWRDPYDLLEDG